MNPTGHAGLRYRISPKSRRPRALILGRRDALPVQRVARFHVLFVVPLVLLAVLGACRVPTRAPSPPPGCGTFETAWSGINSEDAVIAETANEIIAAAGDELIPCAVFVLRTCDPEEATAILARVIESQADRRLMAEALLELTGEPNCAGWWRLGQALRKIGREARDAAEDALDHPSAEVRVVALTILFGGEPIRPELAAKIFPLTHDPDARVRLNAFILLGSHTAEFEGAALIRETALGDPSLAVRQTAVMQCSLWGGPPRAWPGWSRLLESDDPFVRGYARAMKRHFNEPVRPVGRERQNGTTGFDGPG